MAKAQIGFQDSVGSVVSLSLRGSVRIVGKIIDANNHAGMVKIRTEIGVVSIPYAQIQRADFRNPRGSS